MVNPLKSLESDNSNFYFVQKFRKIMLICFTGVLGEFDS